LSATGERADFLRKFYLFAVAAPDLKLDPPHGEKEILLHTCCAPCSSAILETLLNNKLHPTLFFCNPNIYPQEEYLKRKGELISYATQLSLPLYDADDDHSLWLKATEEFRDEPEQGRRCALCFSIRLNATAQFANENGFKVFTTTLGSSRWKKFEQIVEAGEVAATLYPHLTFWGQNWRKQGIADRRDELLKELNFYQQDYCGCETSLTRAEIRRAKAAAKLSQEKSQN